MNSSIKNILIFTFGAFCGSITTYLSVKSYFEDRADKEVESVRNAYNEKVLQFDDKKSTLTGELKGPEEIKETIPKSKSSIVNMLNNKPPLKDYTKYFEEKGEDKEDPSDSEHPEDDEPYTDEEDRKQSIDFIDYQLNGAHRDAIKEGKEPFVIDRSSFELECNHYDKISLVYYISDDVLCEENGEEINRYDYVGYCLDSSGFVQNDDDELFVRNDKLTTDYEITKVYTPYGE